MPLNFTSQERQTLLNNLRVGRRNAIGAIRLARLVGFPTSSNQVRLRTLIKDCIEHDNDLIGAATGRPAGFYIIGTLAELETYLKSLEERTKSNNLRRSALISSWNTLNAIRTTQVPLIIT
ncbi:hypothetical protein ACFGVS_13770 [Mucilaginibacter sp. AW1-7]|uniref:hypothetical protein n=1 Tax=Mucilaginibacter sp. AW1-7 TaxID=3349874 RepID=UPI003F734948